MSIKFKEIFSKKFSSKKSLAKQTINSIFETIKEQDVDFNFSDEDLYLAIDEVITNALEHGNKWDENKSVYVTGYVAPKRFQLSFQDEGYGFDHQNIVKYNKKRDRLNNRGRGLFLISQNFEIEWNDKGNKITITTEIK